MRQAAKSNRRALSRANQIELRRLAKDLGAKGAAEAIGVSRQSLATLAAGMECNGSIVALVERVLAEREA